MTLHLDAKRDISIDLKNWSLEIFSKPDLFKLSAFDSPPKKYGPLPSLIFSSTSCANCQVPATGPKAHRLWRREPHFCWRMRHDIWGDISGELWPVLATLNNTAKEPLVIMNGLISQIEAMVAYSVTFCECGFVGSSEGNALEVWALTETVRGRLKSFRHQVEVLEGKRNKQPMISF